MGTNSGVKKCQDKIREFVHKGVKAKILHCLGDVDIICGGPPCQGISGHNRHRNFESPLEDERSYQIVVFMEIISFLKPKYVLMKNVGDILRYANGSLARYAISCLVRENYQVRLGIMAAGCYGLPQYRLRVFFWGGHHDEVPWSDERPLENKELNAIIGAWFTLWRDSVASCVEF